MNELADNITKGIQFLLAAYADVLPSLQTFSLVVTGVLLFFVVMMMTKANVVGGKRDKFINQWNLADLSKVKVMRAWKDVTQAVASGESARMKKAIIDADKILEEVLREKGFAGKSMDERLNGVDEATVENIKEVWQAHRLAERIKKEPTLSITQNEAWNIIHIYAKVLKDFALID